MKNSSHKLGIIIPYRDRANQLFEFKKEIGKHIDFDFEVIVVEQLGDQDFNRGKLLNIGFLKAEELGCDYVVFHDVDMIPVDVDYSYRAKPTHLISELDLPEGVSRTLFETQIGRTVYVHPIHPYQSLQTKELENLNNVLFFPMLLFFSLLK